jgi:hypothetical protein
MRVLSVFFFCNGKQCEAMAGKKAKNWQLLATGADSIPA